MRLGELQQQGVEPISDLAANTLAVGDTVKASANDSFNCKVIGVQNYFKLEGGFSIDDTGPGNIGNHTTNTIESNMKLQLFQLRLLLLQMHHHLSINFFYNTL